MPGNSSTRIGLVFISLILFVVVVSPPMVSGQAVSANSLLRQWGNSAATQQNGKIVLVGASRIGARFGFEVRRYLPDGTPDGGFGRRGVAELGISGGNLSDDQAESAVIQSDGKIVAAGFSRDSQGNYAFAVARFDTDGTLDKSFGTNGTVRAFITQGDSTYDKAFWVTILPDGKIRVAGYSAICDSDYVSCVAVLNADGRMNETNMLYNPHPSSTNGMSKSTISIASEDRTFQSTLPTDYALYQNFPNPFNPTTEISYQLPSDGQVVLKVFDTLGREVATLVDGYRTAGRYTVTFDAAGLASGVYLYRLTAKNYTQVRKMIVTR